MIHEYGNDSNTARAANVAKMAPAQAITFGCMSSIVPALTGLLV